jgi:hypothetical protein
MFLQDMFRCYRSVRKSLKRMTGNGMAHALRDELTKRLYETADGTFAELAYVLTAEGWTWFSTRRKKANAGNPAAAPSAKIAAMRCAIDNKVEAMRGELNRICTYSNPGEEIKLGQLFDEYLEDTTGPDPDRKILSWWAALRSRDERLFHFATAAWLMPQMPASESAAERAFSVFEALFPRCRVAAGASLLTAELRIRLEQVYDGAKAKAAADWDVGIKARKEQAMFQMVPELDKRRKPGCDKSYKK